MIYVGIDPGLSGGIARIIFHGGPVFEPDSINLYVMPTIPGPRGKNELNLSTVYNLLGYNAPSRITIERAQVFRGQGITSSGRIMENYGRLVGLMAGMRLPFVEVRPQTWQKSFGISSKNGNTKSSSVLVAQQLFPGVNLMATPRCKKPHDGMSDALLIAEWCKRTNNPGEKT